MNFNWSSTHHRRPFTNLYVFVRVKSLYINSSSPFLPLNAHIQFFYSLGKWGLSWGVQKHFFCATRWFFRLFCSDRVCVVSVFLEKKIRKKYLSAYNRKNYGMSKKRRIKDVFIFGWACVGGKLGLDSAVWVRCWGFFLSSTNWQFFYLRLIASYFKGVELEAGLEMMSQLVLDGEFIWESFTAA